MAEESLASVPALLRASDVNGLKSVIESFATTVKSSSAYGTPEACRSVANLLVRPTDCPVAFGASDRNTLRELYAHTSAQPLLCALGTLVPEAALMLVAALPIGTIDAIAPVPEPLLLRLLRSRLFPLAEAVFRRRKKNPTDRGNDGECSVNGSSKKSSLDWSASGFVGFDDDIGNSASHTDYSGCGHNEVNANISGSEDDSLNACSIAVGDKTWFEVALEAGAHGLSLAISEGVECQPLHRTSDGTTFIELVLNDKSLQPSTQSAMLREMIKHGRGASAPLSLLEHTSDGKGLFSQILARQLVIGEDEDAEESDSENNLLCFALKEVGMTGMERIDDGSTVFEALLMNVPRSRVCQRACVQLVKCGGIQPHAILSTGKQVFEQCAQIPAPLVVASLTDCESFKPLSRSTDGKTMFEVALGANCRDSAMKILASGSISRDMLLSDGTTAFEHAVSIAGTAEVVVASLAGQSINALTLLPPRNRTALEIALSHDNTTVASILLALSPDLLALVKPGDSLETCIELIMRYSDSLAAQQISNCDNLDARTRLPSGKTLLEAAASCSATSTCRVLTDRLSSLPAHQS